MESSYLVVMACFDQETTDKIHALKTAACLHQSSCSILPSHISLGFYVGLHPKTLAEWLNRLCARQAPVPMHFTHAGTFGRRVCFLAAEPSQPLLSLHRALHQKFDNFSGEVGLPYTLANGTWVPHCTLFMSDTEDITPALAATSRVFSPFSGKITRLSLGQFGPVKGLGEFPLLGEQS